jgi:hypothetical protein
VKDARYNLNNSLIPKAATPTPLELSRRVSIGIVGAAVFLGAVVLYHVNHSPRTDDTEVFANLIGIAPQAEGPIVRLNVRDNQFVKKGELPYDQRFHDLPRQNKTHPKAEQQRNRPWPRGL